MPPPARAGLDVPAGGHRQAAAWAADLLAQWGVRSPLQAAWLAWAQRAEAAFTLVYEHDRDFGLLTCEVLQGGRAMLGFDDLVSSPEVGTGRR